MGQRPLEGGSSLQFVELLTHLFSICIYDHSEHNVPTEGLDA